MRVSSLAAIILSLGLVSPALAQFKEGDPGGAPVGESRTMKWQAGIVVTASGGPCKSIVGYAAVPTDWPEQRVKIVQEEATSGAKITYQTLDETLKLMLVRIPILPVGEEAKALVTFEIQRSVQVPPKDKDAFVLPDQKHLDPGMRRYLSPSPKIESGDLKIRKVAKDLGVNREKAWEKVEVIYDWAREKVQYEQGGAVKGAVAALKDGNGGHEDITSLFIALCRAKGIPARTVWVPEFCYAEFYLVDAKGEGHWIPCQPAGSKTFGEMPDTKPILAKGDNFRPPYNSRERLRYMKEYLTGTPSRDGGQPVVRFVRQLVN